MRITRDITKPALEVLEIGVEKEVPLESVEGIVISLENIDCIHVGKYTKKTLVSELVVGIQGAQRRFSWPYQLTDFFELKKGERVRGFHRKSGDEEIAYERIYLREIERYDGNRKFLRGMIAPGFEGVE